MSIPVSERLTTLTDSASVLSILEDHQPIYGFHRTSLSFQNSWFELNNSGYGGLEYGKGALPSSSENGSVTWDPHKRFTYNGFIFAENPVYSNDQVGSYKRFARMYYKPFQEDYSSIVQDGGPIYTLSDFRTGGVIYNKVLNQEPFTINLGGVYYTLDDFVFLDDEAYSAEPNNTVFIDLTGDGSVSQSDVLEFNQNIAGIDVATNSDVWGVNQVQVNPLANYNSHFYEVLLQFNAYPSTTLIPLPEITENPGEWSLLMYNSKRDSSFQVSLLNLIEIFQIIGGTISGVVGGGGTVNITAPLLTTSQLENYFTSSASADLNGDGSVSTADLLEFLTAFGDPDVPPPTPTLMQPSEFSYHSGTVDPSGAGIEFLPNYYDISNPPDVSADPLVELSFGKIDFEFHPFSNIHLQGGSDALNDFFINGETAASEVYYRLQGYLTTANPPMAAYTSPAVPVAGIPEREMPSFNKLCWKGSVWDTVLNNSYVDSNAYVFEEIFTSGSDLYTNVGLLFAYGNVSFNDQALGTAIGAAWPPSQQNGFEDYITLSDRANTSEEFLNANARFAVTVQGYVTASSGDAPIAAIFLRMAGISLGANLLDSTVGTYSDYVYCIGSVDMSEGTTYDSENDVKYKFFEFTRDLNTYECPYDDQADQHAPRMPSLVNAASPLFLGIFGCQFLDNAQGIFITGVKYKYINSDNAL